MRGAALCLLWALVSLLVLQPVVGDFDFRASEPDLDHVPPGFEDEDEKVDLAAMFFNELQSHVDELGEIDGLGELADAFDVKRVQTVRSLPDIARILVEVEKVEAGNRVRRPRPVRASREVPHGPDVPRWASQKLMAVTSPNFAEFMQPKVAPAWGVARLLWESMVISNAAPGVKLAFDRLWERLPIVRGRITFGVKLSAGGVINRWEAYFYHRALEQEQQGQLLPTGQEDPQCPLEMTAQEDIMCQLPALCPVTAHYPPAQADAGTAPPLVPATNGSAPPCIFDHMCNSLIIHRDTAVVSVDILNGTGIGSADGVLPDEIGFYNCSLLLPGHFKRGDGWRVAKLNVTQFSANAAPFFAPNEAHGGPDYHWLHGTWHPPSLSPAARTVWNLESMHSLGDLTGLPLPRSRHTAAFRPVRLAWEGDGFCFCPSVEMLDPFFEPSSVFSTLRMELTPEQEAAAWAIILKWKSWTVCVGRKWSQPNPKVEDDPHAAAALAAAAAAPPGEPSPVAATRDGRLPVVYINWQGLDADDFSAYLEERGFPPALRAHFDAHIDLYEGNFFEVHEAHVAPPGSASIYYERAGFHGTV